MKVVRDDGEPAVSITGGWDDHGTILVYGEDDEHGTVYMSGGWTGDLGDGDTARFGAELSVSGLQDRINVGGPIGLMVQSTKGDIKGSVVAIHGIHGGIFLNDPEPNRARTIYIGDKYAGGITIEDGKGMTTADTFGQVNITTKNGGQIELLGNDPFPKTVINHASMRVITEEGEIPSLFLGASNTEEIRDGIMLAFNHGKKNQMHLVSAKDRNYLNMGDDENSSVILFSDKNRSHLEVSNKYGKRVVHCGSGASGEDGIVSTQDKTGSLTSINGTDLSID